MECDINLVRSDLNIRIFKPDSKFISQDIIFGEIYKLDITGFINILLNIQPDRKSHVVLHRFS